MMRILLSATALTAGLFLAPNTLTASDDKSASSVIQLPSAGGTVTSEDGAFRLNANTGSANFSLPLPELQQRGKFGPNTFLSYNQFAGDNGSGLGVGWSFTVPSITVNDDLGTAIPGMKPDGDFFHRLNYSGSRLVFLGQEAGVARYAPEISEDVMEIIRHDAPFEVVTLGRTGELETTTVAAGFDVRMGDGSRMIFSADAAVAEGDFDGPQTHVTRWPLVMTLNANRDVVRYEYEKHGARSYLTGISFAGGQSRYDLELIDTRPSLVSHVGGIAQQNAKLYGKVKSSFNGRVYDQWCFGFIGRDAVDNTAFSVRAHPDCQTQAEADLTDLIDPNSVNVLDQLRIVYRFGHTDGGPLEPDTLRYPDIRFDYSSWTAADLAGRDLVFEAPNLSFIGDLPPGNFELADLNMDALVDIVRTGSGPTEVLLGEGALENAFGTSIPLELTRTTAAGLTQTVVPRLIENKFHFADITGDTYADILEIEDGQLHVFNGNALGEFPYIGRAIALPGIAPELFAGNNGRFVDVNLDGQSDIVATRLNADGQTEFQIYLNLTRRQDDGSYVINFARLSKALPFDSQDGGLLGRRNVRLTDVNGDRLPDLVVIRPADQGFCIYENRGNVFSREPGALLFGDQAATGACGAGQFTAIDGMQPSDNIQSMWYIDANGDGVRDFASMGSRTDQMRVWLGFGDGSFTSQSVALALNEPVQVGAAANSFRSRVADLDADGQSEIIVFQVPSGTEIKPVVVIDFNRTQDMQLTKANLLTVVDFDSGRRHDIRYATSTDEMLRDRAQGRETRTLHFPVIVAKQMVTSEGGPGAPRRDVQTEEYFYHKPFYDIINGRFIGFSEVERVQYGDEFAGGDAVTQRSSMTFEKFYAFADQAADLHLAGKLKIRKTYEVAPNPVLLASAQATIALDPAAAGLHSLSTATRDQGLPQAGKLLNCQSMVWETAPTETPGVSWLRKTSETLTQTAGPEHAQPFDDDVCKDPIKTVTYGDFDAFNIHGTQVDTVRDIAGPEGLTVPGFTLNTQTDYTQARADLAPLGIVTAASSRRVMAGTRVLSQESFSYLPEAGGRLGARRIDVFSALSDIPAGLEDAHLPTHALIRNMAYDTFGNIVEMSDPLGVIETVAFEETGTLPVAHTKLHGQDEALNQVTRMAYGGTHPGLISEQTTPLGMQITYEYDTLGRKVAERASDGGEMLYRYRFGVGDQPSLILTSKRRYASAAETPEMESEFIHSLAAFNARGNQVAALENVTEGGVRVFNFAEHNRNEKLVFRWTPYITDAMGGTALPDVEAVFALGQIPTPERRIGNAYEYDGAGRMVRESHPSGKVSTIEYTAWGSTMLTRYADQFAGDMQTEEARLSNENGLTAVIVSDGADTRHITRFERDSFGFLTAIHLPGEETPRRFAFNSVGDMEYQSVPGMGEHYYFYDTRGRQTHKARIAADGQTDVLRSEYDFLNRKVAEFENGEERYVFTYDRAEPLEVVAAFDTPIALPLGEYTRIDMRDPNGRMDAVQRYGYDANGRMVQNEIRIGGETYAESFHQTLDGRINQATGPGGLSSDFALGPDQNLRAVSINHPDFAQAETVIEELIYNPEGRINRINYRAGAFTQMVFGRDTLFLEEIVSEAGGGVPLQDIEMVFNQNGSITQITDRMAANAPDFGHVDRSATFRYDFKNQLTQINRYGETANFNYSPAGTFERNDEFEAGAALAPAADAETALIPASTDANPYGFDGFGQMAGSPDIADTVFDAYGRLIRAQTATQDVFFGYDQSGRRIYKEIVPRDAPDTAEQYLFPTQTYHVGPKGGESFVNLGSTRLVRMEHGTGRWFYYLKDHLDSSDYVITSDGVPVEQMLYKAYGTEHAPEVLSAAWAAHLEDVSDQTPREKTHHRFTGKYLDDSTGLYYYGARYYDPALGRFISPDPLYMADPERCANNVIACNLFAYANNNPLAFIDPTGLDGVVQGDEAYRRQVEESLQRIDPTARVDSATGEISQSWLHGAWLDIKDFFSPGSGMDTGRELVSRIIDDAQTTTIQFDANNAAMGPADPTVDWTTTPGDMVVYYDPSFTPALTEFDASSGTTSNVAADPGIIIGHELIHAYQAMRGQDSGDTVVNYNGLDGTPHSAVDAEARTVGVGGTTRPDDITENDLREMLGINPRNHY